MIMTAKNETRDVESRLKMKTMKAVFLRLGSLGCWISIYLGQRFETAHGQDRVAEGDQNADQADKFG